MIQNNRLHFYLACNNALKPPTIPVDIILTRTYYPRMTMSKMPTLSSAFICKNIIHSMVFFLLVSCFSSAEETQAQAQPIVESSKEAGELNELYKRFIPKISREIILPLETAIPDKNGFIIDPTTGIKLTRLTDASELKGSEDALVSYSRYTPENSSGELFLAFGSNSTSSWVIERKTGKIIAELTSKNGNGIGEYHEVRWDTSGDWPNRLYYRDGMSLFQINDVYKPIKSTVIIKNFSKQFPNSTLIYNDVEGDSSNNSDHWAFMAAHYDGTTNVVDAFVHYQISTDTTHALTTDMLNGTPLSHYASSKTFPRPNMVEVSPNGEGIVLHYARAWGDKNEGNRPKDINTWFDGPHLWPVDFNIKETKPRKISIDSTHSGWAFDTEGNTFFISQNNRNDYIEAIPTNSQKKNLRIGSHGDMGWSNGFHFGKMPINTPSWTMVSTYSTNQNNSSEKMEWAANQIFLLELKRHSYNSRVFRIGSTYNRYTGDYRDEAIAAINLLGNRIYFASNWAGQIKHREIFVYELPNNWPSLLQ